MIQAKTPLSKFLNEQSKEHAIKKLKQIEVNHLLKTVFLMELKEKMEFCYSEEDKGYTNEDDIKALITFINSQVDGLCETSMDLNNSSFTVKSVCELIETI